MTTFNFKLNRDIIEMTVSLYAGDSLTIECDLGILASGFIKDDKFYLQTLSPEIYFFQKDLIKCAIKAYNKENNTKIN